MAFPQYTFRTNLAENYGAGNPAGVEHQVIHDAIGDTLNEIPYNLAPISSARPGNGVVFLGDAVLGDDVAANVHGWHWAVYASIMSKQYIRYIRNASVDGDTVAEMLARFDTDVTPYSPDTVIVQLSSRDAEQATSFPSWCQSVTELVRKIRGVPAVPVLATVPPHMGGAGGVDKQFLLRQMNGWLLTYAASQGIVLLNFYGTVVDPTNGDWLSAYDNDGIDPNQAGAAALGSYLNTVLTPRMMPTQPPLCQDDIDEASMFYKGTFGGYSGTTVPTGWVDSAGVPSGSVLSYVTDPDVKGQMLKLTHTAVAGQRIFDYVSYYGEGTLDANVSAGATSLDSTVRTDTRGVLFIGDGATAEVVKVASTSGGPPYPTTLTRGLKYAHTAGEPIISNGVAGDTFLITGYITKSTGVTCSVNVRTAADAMIVSPMSDLAEAIDDGVFYGTDILPDSNAYIYTQLVTGTGTGTVQFGQVGLYNVSRLGWPLT